MPQKQDFGDVAEQVNPVVRPDVNQCHAGSGFDCIGEKCAARDDGAEDYCPAVKCPRDSLPKESR